MSEKFNPESLSGISFVDGATGLKMRHIYPDAGHWAAGWLVVQNPSGEWMTLRKATEKDAAAISEAVVSAHHAEAMEET